MSWEGTVKALDEKANCAFLSVVDQLTVVNVTDTTAEITWEAPLCQVEGNIEYVVSYSMADENAITATITDTTFLYTDLSPATNYTFCVLVQHSGVVPDHISACASTYTMPAGGCGCNSLYSRSLLLPQSEPSPLLPLSLPLLPPLLIFLPLLLLK